MGLGKTVQLIALVLADTAAAVDEVGPTLVVCPASILGNWEHELAHFAPRLRAVRHHGAERARSAEDLLAGSDAANASAGSATAAAGGTGTASAANDARDVVVLTSYGTASRDADLLAGIGWRRIALDEAQNVKNPETGRYRAVRRLTAAQRLALTGTPVENRVDELWALLEFVNPGLLGSRAEFRRRFAVPIEAGEAGAAEGLRRLTAPFVLRRVKTDPAIAAELPEKREFKVYCSLTAEQAALYQATVDEALSGITHVEGITRRGRVLALITLLKQVTDHPALVNGDARGGTGSARSGKMTRLVEMLEAVDGATADAAPARGRDAVR